MDEAMYVRLQALEIALRLGCAPDRTVQVAVIFERYLLGDADGLLDAKDPWPDQRPDYGGQIERNLRGDDRVHAAGQERRWDADFAGFSAVGKMTGSFPYAPRSSRKTNG